MSGEEEGQFLASRTIHTQSSAWATQNNNYHKMLKEWFLFHPPNVGWINWFLHSEEEIHISKGQMNLAFLYKAIF